MRASRVDFAKVIVVYSTVLFLAVAGNAGAKTRPFSSYTDEELVQKLQTISSKVNANVNASNLLMALRPDPAYVMTSSTNYMGSFNANVSVYTMPRGYNSRISGTYSGMANTTYSYYDANSFARNMNNLGIAINQMMMQNRLSKMDKVVDEINRRVRQRREAVKREIRQFYSDHPELSGKEMLMSSMMPWVVSSNPNLSTREALEIAGKEVLARTASDTVDGKWHGLFSQVGILEDGETITFNSFITAEFEQAGQHVRGQGYLGTGDIIIIEGDIVSGQFLGSVNNVTSKMKTVFKGEVTGSKIEAEFEGAGAGQVFTGRAVLLR